MNADFDVFLFFRDRRREAQRFRYARQADARELAQDIENEARAVLEGLGYRTAKTGHNEHFDLWVEGVRVEVKGATFTDRYQANLRGNDADVLVFGCVNGATHFFVIPWPALGRRRNLAIWSENPDDYQGRWARFRDAWGIVDDLVADPPRPYQLALPLEV
jgi:hypothetical protein